MSQQKRIMLGILVIVLIVGLVLGIDFLRGQSSATPADLPAGSIPIYLDGEIAGGFTPDDLSRLEEVSFIDAEESKEQTGWLLHDVLQLVIDVNKLTPNSAVTVTSSSREKSIEMPWSEVENGDNMVMFDISGRGTLKLVSSGLPYLDTRDEWIQDVDRIDVSSR